MKFLFIDVLQTRPYIISTPYTEGIGGIQSAICYYCEELVKLGHEVILLNGQSSCIEDRGVSIKPRSWYFEQKKHVVDIILFCSGLTERYFETLHSNFDYQLSIFWNGNHIDETSIKLIPNIIYDIDLFAFVSENQRNDYCDMFQIPLEKTFLMENGYSPCFNFGTNTFEKEKRLIYFSAPERGMELFIDIWPEILKHHPDAFLEIYSSRKNYGQPDTPNAVVVKETLRSFSNTIICDSISQSELANKCKKAAIFAYPCKFIETFCICLLEARVAGCIPVTSDIGVLKSVPDCVPYDEKFKTNYVKKICELLTLFTEDNKTFQQKSMSVSSMFSNVYNYSNLTKILEKNIINLIMKKLDAIQKFHLFKKSNNVDRIIIGQSMPLLLQSKKDIALFWLQMGNAYFSTTRQHICEYYFIKSWNVLNTFAASQNLLIYYEHTRNDNKLLEWYFKAKSVGDISKIRGIHSKVEKMLGFEEIKGWKHFNNIYVISLEGSHKRRLNVESQFKRFGVEFSFFNAINGKKNYELIKKYALDKEIVSKACISELSPGALGCLLSHYKIWEQILLSDKEGWTLICEDDVTFHPSLTNEILQEYLRSIPNDAKFLKFAWFSFNYHKSRILPVNSKWMRFIDRGVPSTICYAVHSSIIKQLLNTRFEHAVDDLEIPGCYGCTDIDTNKDFYFCKTYNTFFNGIASDNNSVSTIIDDKLEIINEYGKRVDIEKHEATEQKLAQTFIKEDDIVLELGARYGSVSCTINKNLKVKTNQVVVEPDSRVWTALEANKLNNKCEFHIVKGFLSNKKWTLTNLDNWYGGYGATSIPSSDSNTPSFSLDEIRTKHKLNFNVLVADCEGFLETFFDENPTFYDYLRMIIFEADYPDKCNYKKIQDALKERGFTELVSGHQNVWSRNDFVAPKLSFDASKQ